MTDRIRSTLRGLWELRTLAPEFPAAQWVALRSVPLLARYSPAEQERLLRLARRFLRKKAIDGARGLAVDDEMRRALAVQACVPILNLGLDWYRDWVQVIVYPEEFVAPHAYVDDAGVVHEGERVLDGESWPEGPVIVSWEQVQRGLSATDWGNVVIHELAHKLDMLNGDANGLPPLHRGMDVGQWSAALGEAYEEFCALVADQDAWLPLDEYAADGPGEFFAVASESFFTEPEVLAEAYPRVYAQLRSFYRQDPLLVQAAP
jgi:hypothetical protein